MGGSSVRSHFDCYRYDVHRYDSQIESRSVNMFGVRDPIPVEALCCPPVTAGALDEATAVEVAGDV
jgi:hypothetical protein